MEMVEILKGRLPEGLEIVKVKDRRNRSQAEIVFRYQGVEVTGWLTKMCTPGNEERICDLAAYNAILQVAIRNNDVSLAQDMFDKIRDGGQSNG